MKIYYIGHYVHLNNSLDYKVALSGVAKMNYIIYALKQAGFSVNVYSLAPYIGGETFAVQNYTFSVDDDEVISYPFCFKENNLLFRVINRLTIYAQFIYLCLFKIKKTDRILVYHSWQYRFAIRLLRLFGKKIFFEIEEIYNAAWKQSNRIKNEVCFLKKASGYIFINDIIAEKCGFNIHKSLVCYGDYRIRNAKEKVRGEKIKLIYAGFIGDECEDVYLALEIMRFLPSNYELSVIGYGSIECINAFCNAISQMNIFLSRTAVEYNGCLVGNAYDQFVATFDIGLCPRKLDDELSDYTFPSKILSYLGLGVIPVCTCLSCISKSEIAENVAFCDSLVPEDIAKVILELELSNFNQNVIDTLNRKFISSLKNIFS